MFNLTLLATVKSIGAKVIQLFASRDQITGRITLELIPAVVLLLLCLYVGCVIHAPDSFQACVQGVTDSMLGLTDTLLE